MKFLYTTVLTLLLTPAFGQTYMQDEDMIYEDQPLQGEMVEQPRGLEREPGGEYVELPQEEEFDPDSESEMDMSEEEATTFGDEEYVE